jgi:SAM-dependent methyltransferase
MDPRTASAVMASIHSNPTGEHVIWEPMWNDALIARSRSLQATKFVEEYTEADVIVMVDDDVVWNPEDFWKLVEGARATRSIYCGPYVTRSDRPHLASRMFPNTPVEIIATPQRRPVEIEYAATGFVAIHRDVFEAMLRGSFEDADFGHRIHRCSKGGGRDFWPFFSTFTLKDVDGAFHYLSEDWAFSERARQIGFTIWMDQSIILQHMGWYPFTVADLKGHDNGLPSTGTDTVEVAGADPNTGEPLLDTLIADIAEWAGEDEGDVRRMLAAGTETVARLWRTKLEDESESAWYEREDVGMAYVGDLAQWHLRGGGAPLGLAAELAGKHVLDFGAGIGTFALAAARAGAEVTAFEPNPTLREFMRWRARKHEITNFATSELTFPLWRFDAIVCWHVFEHLPGPEWALASILDMLRPGGLLISQSDFRCDDGHPMHHEHPDWEGELRRAGFIQERPGVYRLTPVEALVPA